MILYRQIAGSHLGSSAMFGGLFFVATAPTDGLSEAATMGALAAAAWFASHPLIRRIIGAVHGA
jgi:hypothetical protein